METKCIPQTVAEVAISYKTNVEKENRYQIKRSSDAYQVFVNHIIDYDTIEFQETFWVLLLNRANEVLGYRAISIGGIAGTVVDLKTLFSIALTSLCSSILVAHSHPSGNLKPSQADLDLTRKLAEAGKLLELPLLDHLILTSESYYSMSDSGDM